MKILITGTLGNLGQMCIQTTIHKGFKVRAFDRDTPANRELAHTLRQQLGDSLECILGDLQDQAILPGLLEGVSAIIHHASLLPPVTELQPELAHSINVTACQALIDLAAKQPEPPVFVFPSSVTVFGLPENHHEVRTATDPVQPTDHYTRHKATIEAYLQQQDTLPWVIVRVGVSVDARTLKTDRATFRKLLAVRADNPLEWVHPRDIAEAMIQAAILPEARGRILLLGGGKDCQVTQREFLQVAFQSLGLELPESIHGQDAYYTHWMDTRESQSLLHFQHHSFQDYQQEMRDKLAPIRRLLFPFRWLINPLLGPILKRL